MISSADAFAICLGLVAGLGIYFATVPGQLAGAKAATATENVRQRAVARTASSFFVGFVTGALMFLVTGVVGLAVAVAFVGFMAGAWIRSRRELRRQRIVEDYYPELIEGLISQLRSGAGLLAAVATASAGGPDPIALPATRMWQAVQLSGNVSACLDELKARWASPTGDLIAETVRVAHESGGAQTIDVFRELADHVRREGNLRKELQAKQSWVRVAARVGIAAPWVVLVLLSLRSETVAAYNSMAGITMIVCGLALSILAYRFMISLGRLPQPRRIFSS